MEVLVACTALKERVRAGLGRLGERKSGLGRVRGSGLLRAKRPSACGGEGELGRAGRGERWVAGLGQEGSGPRGAGVAGLAWKWVGLLWVLLLFYFLFQTQNSN